MLCGSCITKILPESVIHMIMKRAQLLIESDDKSGKHEYIKCLLLKETFALMLCTESNTSMLACS